MQQNEVCLYRTTAPRGNMYVCVYFMWGYRHTSHSLQSYVLKQLILIFAFCTKEETRFSRVQWLTWDCPTNGGGVGTPILNNWLQSRVLGPHCAAPCCLHPVTGSVVQLKQEGRAVPLDLSKESASLDNTNFSLPCACMCPRMAAAKPQVLILGLQINFSQ